MEQQCKPAIRLCRSLFPEDVERRPSLPTPRSSTSSPTIFGLSCSCGKTCQLLFTNCPFRGPFNRIVATEQRESVTALYCHNRSAGFSKSRNHAVNDSSEGWLLSSLGANRATVWRWIPSFLAASEMLLSSNLKTCRT